MSSAVISFFWASSLGYKAHVHLHLAVATDVQLCSPIMLLGHFDVTGSGNVPQSHVALQEGVADRQAASATTLGFPEPVRP